MTKPTQAEPRVKTSQVEVSVLPEEHVDHQSFALTVEYRGRNTWAVLRHRWCLGADGEWDFESRPSSREDEWLAAHRFDYDTAVRLAIEAAPGVVVNGRTAAEVAQEASR